jgi:cell division protein FtsQ
MAAKDEALTPRQRQSQQLARQRGARKKRKAMLLKCYIIGGAIFGVMLMGGGLWAWKSGAAAHATKAVVDKAYGLTVHAGFSVQSLYLEGRNRTSMDEIEKAMGIKKGDPILRVSLNEVRERLEKIESIKRAAVERSLPDTLHIRIVEREPAALWQHKGKLTPVDDNGTVMNDIDSTPYQHLPLIIGDNAPAHVAELLTILSSEPELAKRFASATREGDRRWNIRLTGTNGNIEVKLPESNPSQAWKKLAEMQANDKLLDRDVQVIDLRLEGRMFIKTSPEDMLHKNRNAKET